MAGPKGEALGSFELKLLSIPSFNKLLAQIYITLIERSEEAGNVTTITGATITTEETESISAQSA
jgi:hypothetical protein